MADSGNRRTGKPPRHPGRKRTMFTVQQREELQLLFQKNRYPSPTLRRETALRIGTEPTAVQVWFKNCRAKLQRAQRTSTQQKQEAAEQRPPEGGGQSGASPERKLDPHPRPLNGAGPAPLVYTDHPIPAFQLSGCPNVKGPTDHSGGHRIIHFGCCRDPNVYCLYPILRSQVLPASIDSPLQRTQHSWPTSK